MIYGDMKANARLVLLSCTLLLVGCSNSTNSSQFFQALSSALLTTEHEITLSNLQPDTQYHYRIGNVSGYFPSLEVNVVRGPYLQMATPTSMTIKWRTDVPTDSRVDYKSVSFTGSHPFVSSPSVGSKKDTRIWVIGDSGSAGDNSGASNPEGVRDAYKSYTGNRGTDVWLMLGDNAYNMGTDVDYQRAMFDVYPELLSQTPLWSTLGNHDSSSANTAAQTGVYYDIFNLPSQAEAGGVASGTEAYYSFDYGNIHFVCLDSQDSDRTVTGPMLTWLVNDLVATQQEWIIAYWHHPPYTDASHNSDIEPRLVQMRENALPILESYGVDLVLSGHSHSYERSYLIDGHYGLSTTMNQATMVLDSGSGNVTGTGAYTKNTAAGNGNKGAVYAVAGSSGKALLGAGSLNHPAMLVSLLKRGSMVIDVSSLRLDASFIDDTGTVLDNFTIIKTP